MTNRATIVLAVLVAAVGAVVVVNPGTARAGHRAEFSLPEPLSHIRVTNDTGSIDLSRTDTGWTVDSLNRPAAPGRIEAFTSHLTGAVSYPVIATSGGPDQYGLGPGTIIDLSDSGGSIRVLLGAPATDGRSVYARIGESRTVVLLPAELVAASTGDARAFRDLVVMRWPESSLLEVRLSDQSGAIVTVTRVVGEATDLPPGTAEGVGVQPADPFGTSILASAQRVQRIAREWRAEGPLADEVMPHHMENMFQELAAVTASSFARTPEGKPPAHRLPIATLVIGTATAGSATLHIYAADADLHPAELDGDLFLISSRRVLRMMMGLPAI